MFSPTDALNEVLVSCETSPVTTGVRLSELLRRPQVTYADLTPIDTERPNYPREIFESVETALKYEATSSASCRTLPKCAGWKRSCCQKRSTTPRFRVCDLRHQEKLNRVRPGKRGTGRAYFWRFPGGYFRAVDLALCTQ